MSETKQQTIRRPRGKQVKVTVTEDMIRDSMQRDSSHCMFATGLQAAKPNAKHIAVDISTVRFSDPERGLRYTFLTPRSVQVAIIDFDQGRKIEPFQVTLRNPQVTLMARARPKRVLSEAEHEQRVRAARAGHEALKRTTLRTTNGGKRPTVPERTGGRTPPLSSFAKRRAYGLRALER